MVSIVSRAGYTTLLFEYNYGWNRSYTFEVNILTLWMTWYDAKHGHVNAKYIDK